MKKILGIGSALVDIVTSIDNDNILEKFALPKGSMQLVDSSQSAHIKEGTSQFKRKQASGGSAANTIYGAAKMGVGTGFIGSIGKDDTGDFFENDMKEAGVTPFLTRRDQATGTVVALISPDSERTFATNLGAAVELKAADLSEDYFKGFDIFYMEGYLIINKPLVERAFSLAKENNLKVAIDLASYNVVNEFLNDFREIINKYVDIVFANEEEAKSFTGLAPEQALYSISEMCDIAVVKVGKDGSMVKRGDEVIKIGPIPAKSVDTTGGGDLYASGFLYGYAKGLPLDKCGICGSVLAGNVIETIGARMDDLRWDKIREELKEQECL